MAAQATAPTTRRATDARRARHQPRRVALPTHAIHFDGRDVTEPVAPRLKVASREVVCCHHCGTIRDARFSFCCEFATLGDVGKPAVATVHPTPLAAAPCEAAASAA